jgi:hypothetical protein
MPQPDEPTCLSLDRISTQWSMINDPGKFLVRYAPAIRSYLQALLRNAHDAEEVEQDFLVRVVQNGFVRASPDRGRFRDYLKTAVRNAALTRLRRKKEAAVGDFALLGLAAADDTIPGTDEQWLADWRRCLLDRAWRALDSHQHRTPGNLFHTVLRAAVDHAEEDSRQLAARVNAQTGREISAEAYRKQLSRARRVFAELLVEEVAQTLEESAAAAVEAELIETGLMSYIRDFLPAAWREQR